MSSTHIILLTGLVFWLLTCWAIMDIVRKDFGDIQKKAIWGFTAMVPFIGVLVYLMFGYKKGTPRV